MQGIKALVTLTFVSWSIYPITWVLGSEGLDAISLEVEVCFACNMYSTFAFSYYSSDSEELYPSRCIQVGLVCLADVVAKLGFGFYLLFAVIETKPGQQVESECFSFRNRFCTVDVCHPDRHRNREDVAGLRSGPLISRSSAHRSCHATGRVTFRYS